MKYRREYVPNFSDSEELEARGYTYQHRRPKLRKGSIVDKQFRPESPDSRVNLTQTVGTYMPDTMAGVEKAVVPTDRKTMETILIKRRQLKLDNHLRKVAHGINSGPIMVSIETEALPTVPLSDRYGHIFGITTIN